jgi:hypothetical protein
MVRRRSTVRFRNGAPRNDQVRSSLDSSHPTLRMGAVPVLGGIWEIASCRAGRAGPAGPARPAGELTPRGTRRVRRGTALATVEQRGRQCGSMAARSRRDSAVGPGEQLSALLPSRLEAAAGGAERMHGPPGSLRTAILRSRVRALLLRAQRNRRASVAGLTAENAELPAVYAGHLQRLPLTRSRSAWPGPASRSGRWPG